ncbi:hypothetical protein JHK84_030818 [Glycine max]|nr:hypothetical protein JHK84_030818 [Glycine max]
MCMIRRSTYICNAIGRELECDMRLKVSSKICVFVMESDEGVPSDKTKTFKEGVCNICETDLENE